MTQMTENDITLAVLASKLDDLRDDIRELKSGTVGRGEYQERNMRIEERFLDHQAQITRIKTQLSAARAPWWSTASVIVAGIALGWAILGPVITGGN